MKQMDTTEEWSKRHCLDDVDCCKILHTMYSFLPQKL